jgi:hypothetical protein
MHDQPFREFSFELYRRDLLETAGPSGMAEIKLLLQLLAGENHLARIDYNNVSTCIHVRTVLSVIFPMQEVGNLRRHSAKHLTLGINKEPLFTDVFFSWEVGTHFLIT